MAKRYIDADALYEQTAEWEARALAVVEKLNSKPLGEMDVNEITEWRKWSCILNERSAFKHDVADAPTANVAEVVRCMDCKHYRDSFPYNTCDVFDAVATDAEDFCSYGERKETEDAKIH